ncbi:ComF family protein [Treponema sp.]|uniref:ComF family protein n=1 Tax=Treponema sp. TaxID=166 RepID=UPI003EFD3F87
MPFKKFTLYDFKYYAMLALNLMFGNGKCCRCGASTFYGLLCRSCSRRLYARAGNFRSDRCRICGKVLLSEFEVCMSCRSGRVLRNSDRVVSVFPYRLWAKTLLFEWKMQNQRSLSLFFAGICDTVIKKSLPEISCIVPVPPRPGKIRSRGWDQIDELVRILEKKYGYTVFRILERTEKLQQKKLDRQKRLSAKGKIYREAALMEKLLIKNALPAHVLLIDDVLTTGVTVESCCEILKKNGIPKVDVLSLFIVD